MMKYNYLRYHTVLNADLPESDPWVSPFEAAPRSTSLLGLLLFAGRLDPT